MSLKRKRSTANQETGISKMEIVFSSTKRVLGEDLFSKFSAQKVEVGLKIMLYNRFISL